MKILDIVPCHRIRERSIVVKGNAFPLCARCTGILLGYLFFPILFFVPLIFPIWIGIILSVPMVIDGWTQKRRYRMSNNTLRMLTGILCGLGQSIIIVGVSLYLIKILNY